MKVLVIEDDKLFCKQLVTDLQQLGYQTKSSSQYDDHLLEFKPEVCLVDIGLPDLNGKDLIKRLTANGSKVIMLTSSELASDEFESLQLGAIDYIQKPYYLPTLDLKLKRLGDENGHVITYNGNTLELSQMKLNGSIKLSKKEIQVMLILMESNNQIVSKKTILNLLWETDLFVEPNNIHVIISRLRKKLEPTNMTINTVNRKGYILE